MLWIIDGLIYGFFTAVYTIFNQRCRLNGYLLGMWRGWGIALCCSPMLWIFGWPTSFYVWLLLVLQGMLIAVYDSRLFFAAAKYGAGATSRIMSLAALVTTVFWWFLTPREFLRLFADGSLLITVFLLLCGFTFCYWRLIKSPVSRKLADYLVPAVLALAGMNVATKETAIAGGSVYGGVTGYLTIALAVSGGINAFWYVRSTKPDIREFFARAFAPRAVRYGGYIIWLGAVTAVAKNLALRSAPNPGYVTALMLIAPLFVFAFNKLGKIPDNISVKEGFSMLGFLVALLVLVTGNFGVTD